MYVSQGVVQEPVYGVEKRRAQRVHVNHKLLIRTADSDAGGSAERAAVFRDLSLLGASMSTRRSLRPGQWIDVVIPTEGAPEDSGLPPFLSGRACVKRVHERPDRTQQVAVSFGPSLAQSLDLATYVAYLLGF